eukprot:COSAG01_NODE_19605_length_1000_cov_6.013319_1_plen_239_part_00
MGAPAKPAPTALSQFCASLEVWASPNAGVVASPTAAAAPSAVLSRFAASVAAWASPSAGMAAEEAAAATAVEAAAETAAVEASAAAAVTAAAVAEEMAQEVAVGSAELEEVHAEMRALYGPLPQFPAVDVQGLSVEEGAAKRARVRAAWLRDEARGQEHWHKGHMLLDAQLFEEAAEDLEREEGVPAVPLAARIFSIVRPQSPMVSASFSKLMAKMHAWRTASALHVRSACIEQGARQ